jgi:hypothetical protein
VDTTNNGKYTGFFSKKLRAGKRRTYFFDVRNTKQGDFFLTITESKKKFDGEGYESHKIFLYKEDFNKFLEALNETVDYIKTDLLPEYDFNSERSNKPLSNHVPETKEETGKETRIATEENALSTPPPQIGDDEQMDWN